jgi:hypothetical protein
VTLLSLLTMPITVKPYVAGAADEYGDSATSFGDPVVWQGRLEMTDSKEVTIGRDTVIADFRLFLPPESDIGPFDRVESEGRTFEVVGLPMLEAAPVGPPSHVLAHLRWVE